MKILFSAYHLISANRRKHVSMQRLPLFPLNTVLFPGMPLTLHIFEDRYKLMVGHCLAEKQPFGVVLLQEGTPEHRTGQKVVTYRTGCTASITQVQPVGLGRMNILAFGKDRFNVLAYDNTEPYLTGEIDLLPLEPPTDDILLHEKARSLRYWIKRYLTLLGKSEKTPTEVSDLPENPAELAYFGASLLKIDIAQKQRLLEEASADNLIREVSRQFHKEVTLLAMMLEDHVADANSPFSMN